MAATTPYRRDPHDPSLAQSSFRERARLAVAGLGVLGLATAIVVSMSNTTTSDNRPDAPPELLDGQNVFPIPLADLPVATPLEPLLAVDRPDRLSVLSPHEGTQRVRRNVPIEFRFNRPMVAGNAVGHDVETLPVAFDPPIAGTGQWTTRSSFSFTAATSVWDANTETRATFATTLRSLAGEPVEDDGVRTFVFGSAPSLVSSYESQRVVREGALQLEFDGPVDLDALRWQLLAYERNGGDRALPFTLQTRAARDENHRLVDVQLARLLEPGSHVALVVSPSILPYSNEPSTLEFEFTPRPRVSGYACPLHATIPSQCSFTDPPGAVVDIGEALRVVATVPLAPVTHANVRVNPPVPGLALTGEGALLSLRGEWEPGQVYEVRFDNLHDAEGQSLARTPPLAVRSAGRDPELHAAPGRFAFEADASPVLRFSGVHLDHAVARYREIEPGRELAALLAHDDDDHDGSGIDSQLAVLAPQARPNRWGRGTFAWIDAPASRNASMAQVRWIANTSDDDAVPHAPVSFVQRTDIGLGARVLEDGVLVWTTGISNAVPIAGASVQLAHKRGEVVGRGRTDADGLAWIPLARADLREQIAVLATRGDERAAILVDSRTAFRPSEMGLGEGEVPGLHGAPAASAITDHGVYRPGETVHGKVFLRQGRPDALRALRGGSITAKLFGNDMAAPIGEAHAEVSEFGTADVTFPLDGHAPLGSYRIEYTRQGFEGALATSTFQVTEYRQPTMRLDLDTPTNEPVAGDALSIPVVGAYLFGAPVRRGQLNWSVQRDTSNAMPQRWHDYVFTAVGAAPRDGTVDSGEFALDDNGSGAVATRVALSTTVRERHTLEVTVRDDAGHEISARRAYTVFPGDVEVGVHTGAEWIDANHALDLDAVVIAHDGTPVAGRAIEARIVREGWHSYWEWSGRNASASEDDPESGDAESGNESETDGVYQQRSHQQREVVNTCSLRSTTEASRCHWMPNRPGTYLLEATVRDEHGHTMTASRRVYVAGPNERPDRDRPSTTFSVTPSRPNWRVGETARIAFESPWEEARALITVEASGVLRAEQRIVRRGGNVFEFPVTAAMVPNVTIAVELVRGRTAPARGHIDLGAPDLRVGAAEIEVRPAVDSLAVSLRAPADHVAPGAEIPIDVQVADAAGRPAHAELVVFAVDEGTLRLSDYTAPDPARSIFRHRAARFAVEDIRRMLVSRAEPFEDALPGGDGGEGGESGAPPNDDRERRDPTILWLPHVRTDAQGRAHATVRAPDGAAQYRFMAIAIDEGIRTGTASADVTVTRPIVMRPAFPQSLVEGDRFEAVAFVHNTTHAPITAQSTVTIDGTVRESRAIEVAPGSDVRIAQWVDAAGDGVRLEFAAEANGVRDLARATVPVRPRGRAVRALETGQIRGTKEVAITLPPGAIPTHGNVTLTVASHPFVGFDASLEAFDDDAYRSAETVASRALALAAYASIRTERASGAEEARELRARGERALTELADYVTADGTLATWPGAEDGSAHETLVALRAVLAAERLGWNIPGSLRERLLAGVRSASTEIEGSSEELHWRDDEALAARLLSDAGERDAARIDTVYTRREQLSPYGQLQLAMAMEASDLRRETLAIAAQNALSSRRVLARTARGETYGPGSTVSSLGAALESGSHIDAIAPWSRAFASALLARRDEGRATWGTIGDTAEALVGLAAYASRFRTNSMTAAQVTLDGHPLAVVSRTRFETRYQLPYASIARGAHRVAMHTPGTAYFALEANYFVALGDAEHESRGRAAAVHRIFETETGAPIADGAHLHVGDRFRVRLFVYDEHAPPAGIVLRDPVCGGCEAIDAGLDTDPRSALSAMLGTGNDDDPNDPRSIHAWQSIDLISHRAFGPDSTAFYIAHGTAGLHEYTYAVRATNAGTYVMPPAQIEAVAQPRYLARSAMTTLVVDP